MALAEGKSENYSALGWADHEEIVGILEDALKDVKGQYVLAIKALRAQAWAKRAEDSQDFAELDAMMQEEGLDMGHDEYIAHCREFADLMTAEVLEGLG